MICVIKTLSKSIKSFLRHSIVLWRYVVDHNIKPKNVDGHYEIYVDGVFECSCDAGELTETIKEVEKSLRNS